MFFCLANLFHLVLSAFHGHGSFHFLLLQTSLVRFRKVHDSFHYYEENGNNVVMPYLKPSDVIQCLLSNHPQLLFGGLEPGPNAEKLLTSFWRCYKNEHSSHAIFAMPDVVLARVIPIVLHGDGGRTLSKQPIDIFSLHPLLGLQTQGIKLQCSCEQSMCYSGDNLDDPMAQRLNFKGNTYLTHFLLCAFAPKRYKKLPGLLASLASAISDDLGKLCSEGLLDPSGKRYWVACLGLKGDMEWHSKFGFTRSYKNVGTVNKIPCCHECRAGDSQYDFENVSDDAPWKRTIYREVPWERTYRSPFSGIPFENWNCGRVASFFRRDIFHIFRLGICRQFVASCLVLLCNEGHYDSPGDSTSVENRLIRAYASFTLWCAATGHRANSIRSFSKEKLHYQTRVSFPWLSCQGADCIVVLKYVSWIVNLLLPDHADSEFLPIMSRVCKAGLDFRAVYHHGIWLRPGCRVKMWASARTFARGYVLLAKKCLDRNLTLFALVPKVHAWCHVFHDLARDSTYTINPAAYDTSMCEDFIGRISRQSRRISAVNPERNLLMAYKVKAKMVINKFTSK